MGRTNPKLVPFLKENLEINRFINLKYEFGDVFYVELPRFDREKCADFEAILKAWYDYNGKLDKYIGYSNGKSVLQAALKKSAYLIVLPCIGKRLRFRFATSDEIKENKKLLKEKTKKDLHSATPSAFLQPATPPESLQLASSPESLQPTSPSDPPSIASSGYISDSEAENVLQDTDVPMQDDIWNDFAIGPHYPVDCGALDEFFNDIEDLRRCEENPSLPNIQPDDMVPLRDILPDGILQLQNIQPDVFTPREEMPHFMRPVTELKTTPVHMPKSVKKYWLCTQKVKVKATLQLICELQVIENENSGIKEGSVVIPNDVFEPGVTYELRKSFELNDLQYFFFSPNF